MSERTKELLLQAHEMYKECNKTELIVDFNGMTMSYTIDPEPSYLDGDETSEVL